MLRHGADDFTSPPKENTLRIFIGFKNPSPSAGFEPANIGSNCKHANNYTAEGDYSYSYSNLHITATYFQTVYTIKVGVKMS
jgi:hypothetical protein